MLASPERIDEEVSETFPARVESLHQARELVVRQARRLGAVGEALDAVRLATSEAVTNVIRHAYGPGADGSFHVTVAAADDELWVMIADDGLGFRIRSHESSLGLGLVVIASVTRELGIVKRAYGGTEVRMCFPFQGV